MREFTAKATLLHATKTDTRIAGAIAVDEHAAGFKFAGHLPGEFDIARVEGGGEAELAVIGQLQRMGCVSGRDD
ncbi:hypothetical protein D9M71_263360 [compost metagenome]